MRKIWSRWPLNTAQSQSSISKSRANSMMINTIKSPTSWRPSSKSSTILRKTTTFSTRPWESSKKISPPSNTSTKPPIIGRPKSPNKPKNYPELSKPQKLPTNPKKPLIKTCFSRQINWRNKWSTPNRRWRTTSKMHNKKCNPSWISFKSISNRIRPWTRRPRTPSRTFKEIYSSTCKEFSTLKSRMQNLRKSKRNRRKSDWKSKIHLITMLKVQKIWTLKSWGWKQNSKIWGRRSKGKKRYAPPSGKKWSSRNNKFSPSELKKTKLSRLPKKSAPQYSPLKTWSAVNKLSEANWKWTSWTNKNQSRTLKKQLKTRLRKSTTQRNLSKSWRNNTKDKKL